MMPTAAARSENRLPVWRARAGQLMCDGRKISRDRSERGPTGPSMRASPQGPDDGRRETGRDRKSRDGSQVGMATEVDHEQRMAAEVE
jgi:hypothetical protein